MEALAAPTPAATESSVKRLGEMIGKSKYSFFEHVSSYYGRKVESIVPQY